MVSVLWCWHIVVGPVSDYCPNKEDTQNTFVSSHHFQLTLCLCNIHNFSFITSFNIDTAEPIVFQAPALCFPCLNCVIMDANVGTRPSNQLF